MVKRRWRGWELNGADSWLVCSSTLFGASQTTLTLNPALWIFSPRLADRLAKQGKSTVFFDHWIHKLTRIYLLHVIFWNEFYYAVDGAAASSICLKLTSRVINWERIETRFIEIYIKLQMKSHFNSINKLHLRQSVVVQWISK